MIAGVELAQHGGRNRCHSGCCTSGAACVFKQAHAFLEHGNRRVGVAGVDEALIVALEARLGLLGILVHEAGIQIERLGGLAEVAAKGPAMHQCSGCLPGFAIGCGAVVTGHHLLQRARPQVGSCA